MDGCCPKLERIMDPDGDRTNDEAFSPLNDQRSPHDVDFVGRIQREMLQLRTSLSKSQQPVFSSSLSYLSDLNQSNVPYLHTSYRGEERARSSQLRLLRDSDLKAILDPLDLPKYEEKPKYKENHNKAAIPPTAAKGGRHSEVGSDADEKKNCNKLAKSQNANHMPTKKSSGKGCKFSAVKLELQDVTKPQTQSNKVRAVANQVESGIRQKLKPKQRIPVTEEHLEPTKACLRSASTMTMDVRLDAAVGTDPLASQPRTSQSPVYRVLKVSTSSPEPSKLAIATKQQTNTALTQILKSSPLKAEGSDEKRGKQNVIPPAPTTPSISSSIKQAPTSGPKIIAEMHPLDTTENPLDKGASSSQDEEDPDTAPKWLIGCLSHQACSTKVMMCTSDEMPPDAGPEQMVADVCSPKNANDYDTSSTSGYDNELKLSDLHTSNAIDHEKRIILAESELMAEGATSFLPNEADSSSSQVETAHRTNDVTNVIDHEQTLVDLHCQLKNIRALLEKQASMSNLQGLSPCGVPRAIKFTSDAATIHSPSSFISNHTTPRFRRLTNRWAIPGRTAVHSIPTSFSPNSSFECDSLSFDGPAIGCSKGRAPQLLNPRKKTQK